MFTEWSSIPNSGVTCFVDWGVLSEFPYNFVSKEKLLEIAKPIADFILKLLEIYGDEYMAKINMAAHSLGNHMFTAVLEYLFDAGKGPIGVFYGNRSSQLFGFQEILHRNFVSLVQIITNK